MLTVATLTLWLAAAPASSIALSDGGGRQLLAIARPDGTVEFRDLCGGPAPARVDTGGPIAALELTEAGVLVAANADGELVATDLSTGKVLSRVRASGPVQAIAADEQWLAAASGRTVDTWKGMAPARHFRFTVDAEVSALHLAGPLYVIPQSAPNAAFYSWNFYRDRWQRAHGEVGHTVFAAQGKLAASACDHGALCLFELVPGPVATLRREAGGVRAVAVSSDGVRVVTGGADGTVRMFEAGCERSREQVSVSAVTHVELSGDGTIVAARAADGTVHLRRLSEPHRQCTTTAAIPPLRLEARAAAAASLEEARSAPKCVRTLDLSRRQLTRAPKELGRLDALEALDLSDNRLTRLDPALTKLARLRELDLGNNRLRRLPPELVELSRLERLDLRGNLFDGYRSPGDAWVALTGFALQHASRHQSVPRVSVEHDLPVEPFVAPGGWDGFTETSLLPIENGTIRFECYGAAPASASPQERATACAGGKELYVYGPSGARKAQVVEFTAEAQEGAGEVVLGAAKTPHRDAWFAATDGRVGTVDFVAAPSLRQVTPKVGPRRVRELLDSPKLVVRGLREFATPPVAGRLIQFETVGHMAGDGYAPDRVGWGTVVARLREGRLQVLSSETGIIDKCGREFRMEVIGTFRYGDDPLPDLLIGPSPYTVIERRPDGEFLRATALPACLGC